jgi:plasmid stabilization system protein ParE
MPKVAILFSESAVSDLEELKTWYAEQGVPDVGDRFVMEIIEKIETLRDHPDIGRIVPEFEQRVLREIIRPPFRIVYRHEPKKVRVVRVWRTERLLHLPTD